MSNTIDQDVAVLKSQMSDVRTDLASISGKLDQVIAKQNEQRGAAKLAALVASAIGAFLALVGEWAIAHFK